MKIRPRYGTDPVTTYEGDPAAVAVPAVRQRRRLAQTLAAFGPGEWGAPGRCAEWTNRDVVVHLASTNRFWAHSIVQARRGAPTEMLADFDPAAPIAIGGPALDVLEGLSLRAPTEVTPEWQWPTTGIARAFEAPTP